MVRKTVKTGVTVVSLRFVKSNATTDYDFPNKFLNSIPAAPKDSGDRHRIRTYHWFIQLALVSSDRESRCNFFPCVISNFLLCVESKPAQRVFKVGMKFPTSVLCNEAGQGVLRQKVRTAINSLNREWNFCSYSMKGEIR